MSKLYYAVRIGVKPGIYTSWPECERQVSKYSKAEYKSFKTLQEALDYLKAPSRATGAPVLTENDLNEIAGAFNGTGVALVKRSLGNARWYTVS
jgi:viroplasmin and RNaseH domain-containing protein